MKKLFGIGIIILFAVTAFAQANNTPPTQTQAPAGKHMPEAKTPEEFKAFQAAMANTDPAKGSPADAEAAANDFAAKYPESELRAALLQAVMTRYDGAGNSEKALLLARKILTLEPDNTVALVLAAANLAEHTHETDLDKDERLNEAATDANKALGLIDDMPMPATLTPEQVKVARDSLRAWAWNAVGITQYIRNDYAAAETSFQKAAEFGKARPDPVTLLRLALAEDHLGKYPDALTNIEAVLKLVPPDSPVAKLAGQEKERLTKIQQAQPK